MHSNSKFQVAATCTICNLVCRDENGDFCLKLGFETIAQLNTDFNFIGYFERQSVLKELGVNKLLQQLLLTKDAVLFEK